MSVDAFKPVLRALAALIMLLLCSAALVAQGGDLYTWTGSADYDYFGGPVRAAGDVDGDGTPDIVIGQTGPYSSQHGEVWVRSGADGDVLWHFVSPETNDDFGMCDGAGDVNGDGFADIVVGARHDSTVGLHSGLAVVYSGADGSALYTWYGDGDGLTGDWLGEFVSAAGDPDNDGFADVFVGAPHGLAPGGLRPGYARLFSGDDGSVLHTWYGNEQNDWFGRVSDAGDFDGDGHDDLLVGAHQTHALPIGTNEGYADVYSGDGWGLLEHWTGEGEQHHAGYVGALGDLDGDGYTELAVGSPGIHVRIFTGVDGSLLHTIEAPVVHPAQFGRELGRAGDFDGDGQDDVWIGAPRFSLPGWGAVYAGDDFVQLHRFQGESSGGGFGLGEGVGDLDGDGRSELAIGAPESSAVAFKAGKVRVLRGRTWWMPEMGFDPLAPVLEGWGDLLRGEPFDLALQNADPASPAFLVVGLSFLGQPFKGSVLGPSPDALLPIVTDDAGGWSVGGEFPFTVPAGTGFWFQAWIQDHLNPASYEASQVIRGIVGG